MPVMLDRSNLGGLQSRLLNMAGENVNVMRQQVTDYIGGLNSSNQGRQAFDEVLNLAHSSLPNGVLGSLPGFMKTKLKEVGLPFPQKTDEVAQWQRTIERLKGSAGEFVSDSGLDMAKFQSLMDKKEKTFESVSNLFGHLADQKQGLLGKLL